MTSEVCCVQHVPPVGVARIGCMPSLSSTIDAPVPPQSSSQSTSSACPSIEASPPHASRGKGGGKSKHNSSAHSSQCGRSDGLPGKGGGKPKHHRSSGKSGVLSPPCGSLAGSHGKDGISAQGKNALGTQCGHLDSSAQGKHAFIPRGSYIKHVLHPPSHRPNGQNAVASAAVRGGRWGPRRTSSKESSAEEPIDTISQELFGAIVKAVTASVRPVASHVEGGNTPSRGAYRSQRLNLCRNWSCGGACHFGESCRFLHGDTPAEVARVRAARALNPFPTRALWDG